MLLMLPIILASAYFFLGGLLAAALLTDRNCNTNRLEATFCVIAGILWPLAIAVAASFGLYDNIKEKITTKRRARWERMLRLGVMLLKLQLISKDTYMAVQKRMY